MSENKTKILIIRLSSLGDVLLASSVLKYLHQMGKSLEIHFLTGTEYTSLLNGNAYINKIIEFDRHGGIKEIKKVFGIISSEEYFAVLDLHRSLRTSIFKLLYAFSPVRPYWVRIKKHRLKLKLLFVFKKISPLNFRPPHVLDEILDGAKKLLRLVLQEGSQNFANSEKLRCELSYLLLESKNLNIEDEIKEILGKKYICIMPSSQWESKCLPVDKFLYIIQKLYEKSGYISVVLGSLKDSRSIILESELRIKNIPFVSLIGKNLSTVATVLKSSKLYFGNDTGIAHLAEGLQVPAFVFYGPTTPNIGFGVRGNESKAFLAGVWCQPCSKDGRTCFRIFNRYACLKEMDEKKILENILGFIRRSDS